MIPVADNACGLHWFATLEKAIEFVITEVNAGRSATVYPPGFLPEPIASDLTNANHAA